ncbi:MAG: hypothetical protein R3266_10645, partial [Gemmatimonadota bacterium]|nr:hypothetical protein [Gemmatimonadota bacterium]
MLRDRPLITGLALLLAGFALSSCGGEGPESVAQRFWEAAQARDVETVEALSIPSENASFDFEDEDTAVGSIEVGNAEIEGDRAEVPTRLEMVGQEMELEVDFATVVARHEGEWLVDLDETGD